MLPSSQMNTNPFEAVPNDSSRSGTPTPSSHESSAALTPLTTPNSTSVDAPFLPSAQSPDQPSPDQPSSDRPSSDQPSSTPTTRAPSRSFSSTFVSSPLNPNSNPASPYGFARPRPISVSRGSVHLSRIASEDSQVLGSQLPSAQRGSMILWHIHPPDDQGVLLPPPSLTNDPRTSVLTTASGESIWTLSSDSKYPSGPPTTMRGGLVPYAWDPSVDDYQDGPDDDDNLHGPDKPSPLLNTRSVSNLGVLVLLITTLLALFIALPVITYVRDNANSVFFETGSNTVNDPQVDLHTPTLIDADTPDSAKTRVGYDGQDYVLVFSDEFNLDGRSFHPGDDPFWEAVDLWYSNTGDLEWYDPAQVYTANGSLHVRLDNVPLNGMSYRSGMLQSWNKFCFTSGYIEVSASLPGPNDETRGYVSFITFYSLQFCPVLTTLSSSGLEFGRWAISPDPDTVQRLTACGHTRKYSYVIPVSALTIARFPRYDSCDVGTLPNQTWVNGTGPPAALSTTAGQAKYNYKLSYLTGQRLSYAISADSAFPYPIFFLFFFIQCVYLLWRGPPRSKPQQGSWCAGN